MEVYVNEPNIAGPILGAVAVDSFAVGATLQLGSAGKVYTVAGRDIEFAPDGGWDQVKTTGTITLKVYRAPLQGNERPGARGSGSGAAAPDASQNTKVVGPDAVGGPPAGQPVVVGVVDVAGNIRRMFSPGTAGVIGAHPTDAGGTSLVGTPGSGVPARAAQVGGKDAAGNLQAIALETATGRVQTTGRAPGGQIFKGGLLALLGASPANGVALWTPAAGKKFRLQGMVVTLSVAGLLVFNDAASVVGPPAGGPIEITVVAGAPIAVPFGPDGLLSTAANNLFIANGPVGNLTFTLWGVEE